MSFEPFPGVKLRGPPVPDDPSSLMHICTGPSCTFYAWWRENPIELGWEIKGCWSPKKLVLMAQHSVEWI